MTDSRNPRTPHPPIAPRPSIRVRARARTERKIPTNPLRARDVTTGELPTLVTLNRRRPSQMRRANLRRNPPRGLGLGWISRYRDRQRRQADAQGVDLAINCLGRLMVAYPGHFIDESWLPVPKPALRRAIKAALLAADSEAIRESLAVAWEILPQFQQGIGDQPIGFPTGLDPLAPEVLKAHVRFCELVRVSTEEAMAAAKELEPVLRTIKPTNEG